MRRIECRPSLLESVSRPENHSTLGRKRFAAALDRSLGVETVHVKAIVPDKTAFPQKYDPSNPAADPNGYVRMPNVNSFVEMMDMREAERTYSANLNVMQASRSMLTRVIDLLK